MTNPMTLADYLADKKLWDSINKIKQFPFLEGNLLSVMESSLKVQYGKRLMFSTLADMDIDMVAQQLVIMYGDKWTILTTGNTDMPLSGDYVIKKDGTANKNTTRDTDSDSQHKTVAYNESDLTTESGDTSSNKDVTGEKADNASSEAKVSYTSYFKNLQNVDRLNIISLILRDAAKLLTISVY